MAGYELIRKIRKLEEECNRLGFMICHSKYGYRQEFGDVLALKPKEDSLPIYARDAELFVGTINDLEQWLKGIEWARTYDRMLIDKKLDDKRSRKEQDYKNRELLQKIANPE